MFGAAGREVEVQTTDPVRTLHELTGEALARGEELEGLEVTRPSLEDVYLELTEPPGDPRSGDPQAAELPAAEEAPR